MFKILRLVSFVFIAVILSACQNEVQVADWDGHWKRQIDVPQGLSGRCIKEILTIDRKRWHVSAEIHSTYKCDQPFMELEYEGVLEVVEIKKNTQDRQFTLKVSEIRLSSLVDVAGDDRMTLSDKSLERLSSKYVPQEFVSFDQRMILSADKLSMKGLLYKPLVDFAIPDYPDDERLVKYIKL